MNITELARKLKITPKELKVCLPELGFHIGPRAIQIPDEQAARVIKMWPEIKRKEEALKKLQAKVSGPAEESQVEEEKKVVIGPTIQVYRLAEKLNLPVTKVMHELVKNGVLVSVNENLDYEIAAILAESLGFKVEKGEVEEEKPTALIKGKLKKVITRAEKEKLRERPPVIVVMGHVDHGKSMILSVIREVEMLSKEDGGITQHIGAYQVEKNNRKITFIDTPGHEAFQAMRARGGEVADIAILVIAADDKIQPQTLESIEIIQEENLPFIVAINKIDKPEADIEKIKKGLSEINLTPEDWGGKVICVPTSAKTKEGIDELLEMILLVTDMEKERLVADPEGEVVATVIESHLDPGVGPIASVIVYNGALEKGASVIVGRSFGRLKSIKDENGLSLEKAFPGQPAQIFGLKGVPQAGAILEVVTDRREFKKRTKQLKLSYQKKIVVDRERVIKEKEKKVKYLNLILRADVLGSLEAISKDIEKLERPQVKINILKKSLGNLTESDVDLAQSTEARLIGFNVGIGQRARELAREREIPVDIYQVIYDLTGKVKEEVNKLIPAEITEEKLGRLEVLAVFRKSGNETIFGGKILEGEARISFITRVWKDKELKGEGKIVQLQIARKDVEKVKSGAECGIKFEGKVDIEVGDILEIYQEVKKERKFTHDS